MKTVHLLLFSLLAFGLNTACSAQSDDNTNSGQVKPADKVEVFYFHYTRRCATCQAVESVSKEALAEYYGSKVNFADYNLDEDAGKAKGEELDVSGQTLLIVAGDTQINITNEGFMNARSNPEKLKSLIKEKIDPLL